MLNPHISPPGPPLALLAKQDGDDQQQGGDDRTFKSKRPTGQQVRAGEKLAVIEAMKMENILRAEKDCKVKAVVAAVGDSLSVDQVIVEYE